MISFFWAFILFCIVASTDFIVSLLLQEEPGTFSFFPLTHKVLDGCTNPILKHIFGIIVTILCLPLTVYRLLMFVVLFIILLVVDIIDYLKKGNKKS